MLLYRAMTNKIVLNGALPQTKVEQKRVFQLAVAEAYFDDEQHFRQMKALCSFSHPALTDSNGRCV